MGKKNKLSLWAHPPSRLSSRLRQIWPDQRRESVQPCGLATRGVSRPGMHGRGSACLLVPGIQGRILVHAQVYTSLEHGPCTIQFINSCFLFHCKYYRLQEALSSVLVVSKSSIPFYTCDDRCSTFGHILCTSYQKWENCEILNL